eukprot:1614658-Heterocapsa_arctica.AAC.1
MAASSTSTRATFSRTSRSARSQVSAARRPAFAQVGRGDIRTDRVLVAASYCWKAYSGSWAPRIEIRT